MQVDNRENSTSIHNSSPHFSWNNSIWIKVNNNADNSKGGLSTFRREFQTENKEISSAKLYFSSLGVCDIYINGKRVGQLNESGETVFDELKPGVADNDKRVFYLTYDVAHLIVNSKKNVISTSVSSGWWNGIVAYAKRKTTNAFIAKLIITYTDGNSEIISTDNLWKTNFCGPVISADIFDGEVYDANIDTSYRKSDYDDSSWHNAEECTEFKGEISAQIGTPVRERKDLALTPKSITIYDKINGANEKEHGKINVVKRFDNSEEIVLKKGETAIYDMGQNFSGVDDITISGKKNTRVTIRHSEMLNDCNGLLSRSNDGAEGSLHVRNLRGAKATAVYILCGSKKEQYSPLHTYFGYRYVEITATADITIHKLIGKVLTSALTDTGYISTSNEKLNRLISNIKWGQLSNYLYIPTDCNQRAERQGWTADTQVFSTAACYLSDSKLFLEKWMQDMRDSQDENGAYPNTAPANYEGGGVAAWGDAGIIVPYNLYKMYGDKKVLSDNYKSMKLFMDVFMASTNKNGGHHAFGDWLAYQETDMQVISVAYYAADAKMMSKIAGVLGYLDDEVKYEEIYKIEKDYFIELFLDNDGSIKTPTQTTCLLALKNGLYLNENSKEKIIKQLLDNIKASGDKLQTGFLGTAIILQTLSDVGASDVAYTLLLQNRNPSWLYSVDQGATTIWERWDSYTAENGFGDPSIDDSSFNHYSYGAVLEWMFRYMAGIQYDFDKPGFKHFILQPTISKDLSFVNAEYISINGAIKSCWELNGGTLLYNCTVSTNTTATLYLPLIPNTSIFVNGVDVFKNEVFGADVLEIKNNLITFDLLAGEYDFSLSVR